MKMQLILSGIPFFLSLLCVTKCLIFFFFFYSSPGNHDKMSFVKKMLGQRGGDSPQAGQAPDSNLGLMHLRKLFTEFRHPTVKSTQKKQEEKLYSMLPLFIKVHTLLVFQFKCVSQRCVSI